MVVGIYVKSHLVYHILNSKIQLISHEVISDLNNAGTNPYHN